MSQLFLKGKESLEKSFEVWRSSDLWSFAANTSLIVYGDIGQLEPSNLSSALRMPEILISSDIAKNNYKKYRWDNAILGGFIHQNVLKQYNIEE